MQSNQSFLFAPADSVGSIYECSNDHGLDQSAQMRRLVLAFAVHIRVKHIFACRNSNYPVMHIIRFSSLIETKWSILYVINSDQFNMLCLMES